MYKKGKRILASCIILSFLIGLYNLSYKTNIEAETYTDIVTRNFCMENDFYIDVKDESEDIDDYIYDHKQSIETVFIVHSSLEADHYVVEVSSDNIEIMSEMEYETEEINAEEINVKFASKDEGEGIVTISVEAYRGNAKVAYNNYYYNIDVVVYSSGDNVKVINGGLLGTRYEQEMFIHVERGQLTLDAGTFVIDTKDDAGTAFMTQQAAAEESIFIKNVFGEYLDEVTVKFPTMGNTEFNSLTDVIRITEEYGKSWDAIQHEYSHYVDKNFNVTGGKGGDHYSWFNMVDDPYDLILFGNTKKNVIELEWSEGFATYLMAVEQEIMDDYYSDKIHCIALTYDDAGNKGEISYKVNDRMFCASYSTQLGFDYDNLNQIYSYGEFGEVAIGCVLYDLTVTLLGDDWHEGNYAERCKTYQSVWDHFVDLDAASFSEFSQAFWEKYKYKFELLHDIGIDYSLFGMSSKECNTSSKYYTLVAEAGKKSGVRTFKWKPGTGSEKYPNDSFYIVFYDEDGTDLWHSDGYIADTEFTLTLDNWSNILAYVDGGQIYWQISEKNTLSPETGPYVSAAGVIDTANIEYGLDTPENLRNVYYTSSGAGAVLAPGMVLNAVPGVAWNPVPGAQKYYIYRSAQRDGNYTYWKSVTTTQVMDESASAGITCYYKIRAVSETDISDLSSAIDMGLLAPKQSDPNVATVAAHRDAETMVLMIGGDLTTMQTNVRTLHGAWVSPVFNVFGSPWNQEPCPQLWNYYYNLYAAEYAN